MFVNLGLLLLGLGSTGCTGQVKEPRPLPSAATPPPFKDTGLGLPKTSAELRASAAAGIDPYFVTPPDTFSTRGPRCIVRDLLQDKAGAYWLATWQGIVGYDGKVFTNYTLKEGLIRFHVGSLFEDSKGTLWFGTVRGGVYRYDGKAFTLFTTADGLVDNSAGCIAEDKAGNIWFGTEHGVSRYDGKRFTSFTTTDGLSDDYVSAILRDKTGTLWFGTTKGVDRYDGKTFTRFTGPDGVPFQRVASLFEDKAGNVWIGSNAAEAGGKGLCRYDGKQVTEAVTPNFVMYMCQDRQGGLWLAHNDWPANARFSLYRYDGQAFTKLLEQDQPDNPLIFGIMEDHAGDIWFGTTKGVCRYDGHTFDYLQQ